MQWPEWVEELRQRYLTDEGNVILLHGALTDASWPVEGRPLCARDVLRELLTRTRDVMGTWNPDTGLVLPNLHDRTRFDSVIATQRLISHRTRHLARDEPDQALALIWEALGHADARQAYFLTDVHRLAPLGSRAGRWQALPNRTPALNRWSSSPALRGRDSLVILFADFAQARASLAEELGAITIEVPTVAPTPSPQPEAEATEIKATARPAIVPPPVSSADGGLAHDLAVALREAMERRETGPWPQLEPALEACAAVLFERRPDRFGMIRVQIQSDQLVAEGRGGEDLLSWLEGDIAARTAAEMALENHPSESPRPEAVAALARRLQRLIEA